MTVPHLMNCPHTDSGWCTECVAELGNENWRLRAALLELVDLENLRDKHSFHGEWARNRIREDYYRRLPLAWAAAGHALGLGPNV